MGKIELMERTKVGKIELRGRHKLDSRPFENVTSGMRNTGDSYHRGFAVKTSSVARNQQKPELKSCQS